MINLERFLRAHVGIRNEGGGRGYDYGIRTFDCPLCGDTKGRGWLGVTQWGAGCFNAGCDAEPALEGGALEWARRVLRAPTRAAAIAVLEEKYGGLPPARKAPTRSPDFCRLPPNSRPFAAWTDTPRLQAPFLSFMRKQWGIGIEDAVYWGLRWDLSTFRVVIPVVMGGVTVGFQARTIRDGAEPKYLFSRCGVLADPNAECGRPGAAMLYNLDAVRPGGTVVLVEGPGDVMGWYQQHERPPAVAIFGLSLTAEKLALLKLAKPGLVVVALDAQREAQQRATSHLATLEAWGIPSRRGIWTGGKDAGSGATLHAQGFDSARKEVAR